MSGGLPEAKPWASCWFMSVATTTSIELPDSSAHAVGGFGDGGGLGITGRRDQHRQLGAALAAGGRLGSGLGGGDGGGGDEHSEECPRLGWCAS